MNQKPCLLEVTPGSHRLDQVCCLNDLQRRKQPLLYFAPEVGGKVGQAQEGEGSI